MGGERSKEETGGAKRLRQVLVGLEVTGYPVVRRERFGARGIYIPYRFPIQRGAKELLRVSQPSNSWNMLEHVFFF